MLLGPNQRRMLYACLPARQVDELLRHFWRLIPVNTNEKIRKFQRIQVGAVAHSRGPVTCVLLCCARAGVAPALQRRSHQRVSRLCKSHASAPCALDGRHTAPRHAAMQKSMDEAYEVLNRVLQQCEPQHKAPLTRLVKPLFDQLDMAGLAAKNVQRALSSKGIGGGKAPRRA